RSVAGVWAWFGVGFFASVTVSQGSPPLDDGLSGSNPPGRWGRRYPSSAADGGFAPGRDTVIAAARTARSRIGPHCSGPQARTTSAGAVPPGTTWEALRNRASISATIVPITVSPAPIVSATSTAGAAAETSPRAV